LKYFFDLSTTARWSGHAVGIVRVERELARRAALIDPDIAFCIYVPHENAFHRLRPDIVDDILSGRLGVEFGPGPPPPLAAVPDSLRFRVREAVLALPRLYQILQRLKGRSFTLDEIAAVKRDEAARRAAPVPSPVAAKRTIQEASAGRIDLSSKVTIISGGLDWEYKDLRAIYDLKQVHKFRYAAVVYDLIPQIFPHYVVPSYVGLLKDYFGELFWTADICMCISECTRRDMIKYCSDNGVPQPRSAAFPLGCDIPDEPAQLGALPAQLAGKRYALFVSTIEPRKNHRTLYAAWARCIEQGLIDPDRCRLVFVGRTGWATGDLLQEIENNPATESTILRLSGVSDSELNALYRGAAFGLFPSFYEGYGLPLAEMLNHGKACISSRSGSLEEVGGSFVEYVDPLDTIAWSSQLARYFNDEAACADLESRVAASYRPVTWDDAASLFFERLKALA